jgi:hypothetical protein
MNPKRIEDANDPLLPASFVALKRAARRVWEEARRNHTEIVQLRDGKIVHVRPWEEAEEEP